MSVYGTVCLYGHWSPYRGIPQFRIIQFEKKDNSNSFICICILHSAQVKVTSYNVYLFKIININHKCEMYKFNPLR